MEAKEGNPPQVESTGDEGKRTAFLVIHGMGEQNPFDTLDGFVCGLHTYFKSIKVGSEVSHRLTRRDAVGGGQWTESFIQFDANTGHREHRIDVHECYWADLTEKKISLEEVYSWLLGALWGLRRFYKSDWEMAAGRGKRKIIKSNLYLFLQLFLFGYGILIVLLPVLVAAYYFGLFGPHLSLINLIDDYWVQGSAGLALLYGLSRFKPLVSFLKKKFGAFLTDYIGDVVIYTSTDEKSSRFKLRQQILARTQSLLENLLKDPRYDRVIVAGHSLGSVIAYDILNRINIKENLEPGALPVNKIAGLITFGSPLDKVALFFGQHAGKNQHVRRQIMEQLYSFRAIPLDSTRNPFKVGNPIEQKLDGIPWINYWSSKDPISGHLDLYAPLDNMHLDVKGLWGYAHVKYWETDALYADILKRYFT